MRFVFTLVLLLGLGLAGSAAYLAMQKFNEYEAQIRAEKRNNAPAIELVEIAVAAENLIFATILKPEDVRMLKWPKDSIPEGAFTSLVDLMGEEGGDPRSIIRVMIKDEPILAPKVTEFGQDAGIRSRLSPGMRAFTIRVDVNTGVSGFLQPNDNVDIYWTAPNGAGSFTKLFLENIHIIAIDQNTDADVTAIRIAKTVTVEVSPQVVAELTQAQQSGRLTLSLRGVQDGILTGALEVNQNDISGIEIKEVEAVRVCTRRTRKGTEVIIEEVPCTD